MTDRGGTRTGPSGWTGEGGRGKGREREREREREWAHILALHGASLEDGVARALRAAEGGIISDGLATDEAG